MNRKNIILHVILYGLLIFGVIGSGSLAYSELLEQDICPKLGGIPACYIIFICFIALFGLHISKISSKYFYFIAGCPLLIAMYGSYGQIFGGIECPKTDGGIPMCFISLFLFSLIVLCKYFLTRERSE